MLEAGTELVRHLYVYVYIYVWVCTGSQFIVFPGDHPQSDKLRLTERNFPSVPEPAPTWTKLQSRCHVCSRKGWCWDV